MRLVMTLLARDEADVVDAQIAFHLHAGVDFVVAIDNASSDGTTEILERYERAGVLRLLREPADDMRQDTWVTAMARLAAVEHGADWVINSDADEFWWPRGGSLKAVLDLVPQRFGIVRGCWRHFLPRPDDGRFFAERMTVRLAAPAHPGDKETVFHAHQKVAHRGHPAVEVEFGNHDAAAPGLVPLRNWHPIEVLHFSFRSSVQAERKAGGGWLRNEKYVAALHQLRLDEAVRKGQTTSFYEESMVDDDVLAVGLADGTLALDTRLRDVLGSIRGPDATFLMPGDCPPLVFPRPGIHDDAALAAEIAPLHEIDGLVRASARVRDLESRLARLERGTLRRLLRLAP